MAQFAGSRGGLGGYPSSGQTKSNVVVTVDPTIQQYIKIDSQVEVRVKPDQIRIVLAVVKDAATSAECEKLVFGKIKELREALIASGLAKENIVDDFIAILPRYEFEIEIREGEKFAVEKLVGHSMQSNLHIKVKDDAEAMGAIRAAFKLGITDVIGFDYWSSELESTREQALQLAIKKAKAKADILLSATFDKMPQPINVDSSTRLDLPKSQYTSFQNVRSQSIAQDYSYYSRKNLPVIRASRPANTYYQGYLATGNDVFPNAVPMRSEISVISSVRIYYASPVAKEYRELEAKAGSNK
jgi:uncharacterized protein YggE